MEPLSVIIFKDETFMIVPREDAYWFETQPDWDRTEQLTREENGHTVNS